MVLKGWSGEPSKTPEDVTYNVVEVTEDVDTEKCWTDCEDVEVELMVGENTHMSSNNDGNSNNVYISTAALDFLSKGNDKVWQHLQNLFL